MLPGLVFRVKLETTTKTVIPNRKGTTDNISIIDHSIATVCTTALNQPCVLAGMKVMIAIARFTRALLRPVPVTRGRQCDCIVIMLVFIPYDAEYTHTYDIPLRTVTQLHIMFTVSDP